MLALVVQLQQGKGVDISSAFGGGSQTTFGAWNRASRSAAAV